MVNRLSGLIRYTARRASLLGFTIHRTAPNSNPTSVSAGQGLDGGRDRVEPVTSSVSANRTARTGQYDTTSHMALPQFRDSAASGADRRPAVGTAFDPLGTVCDKKWRTPAPGQDRSTSFGRYLMRRLSQPLFGCSHRLPGRSRH